jgi:hypothetical protein
MGRRQNCLVLFVCVGVGTLGGCATRRSPPADRPPIASPMVHTPMAPIPNPPARARPQPRARAHVIRPHKPPVQSPRPASVARDPKRAASLRGAGLDKLNRGEAAHAKLLLQQARRLDPENPHIQRDLDRAVRLSSVQSEP